MLGIGRLSDFRLYLGLSREVNPPSVVLPIFDIVWYTNDYVNEFHVTVTQSLLYLFDTQKKRREFVIYRHFTDKY